MKIGRPKSEMIERTKAIRADLIRLYKLDELRQELFDEQSSLCAVCKEPLQSSDSVVTAVDHSTSIFIWAQSQLSIEEASRYANDRTNLQAIHVSCNAVKKALDHEEFVERIELGDISLSPAKTFTAEKIQELKDFYIERSRKAGRIGGRIGGRIAGRKAVESGQLARISNLPQTKEAQRISGRMNAEKGVGVHGRTPEQMSRDGRKGGRIAAEKSLGVHGRTPEQMSIDGCKGGRIGGRIAGQITVESGHIQALGRSGIGGRISGRIAVESGHLASIRTPENCAKGGRVSGRKHVESGHLASIQTLENQTKGGRIRGRIAVESGQFAPLNHNRWHVARGIQKEDCKFCFPANQTSAGGRTGSGSHIQDIRIVQKHTNEVFADAA